MKYDFVCEFISEGTDGSQREDRHRRCAAIIHWTLTSFPIPTFLFAPLCVQDAELLTKKPPLNNCGGFLYLYYKIS